MKKTTVVLSVAVSALLMACNNQQEPTAETAGGRDSVSITDSLNRRDRVRAEIEDYRIRLKNKLDELKRDIESAREHRKMEKNLKKQREYDLAIEQGEKTRKTFQEKLDKMGDNMESGWDNFKSEVDDVFNSYRNDSPARADSINQLKLK